MKRVRPILDQNSFSFASVGDIDKGTQKLIRRRMDTVGPAAMLFYREPLHIVKGAGVWLYDDQGRRYLDTYNNVACLGHCHPRVVEAVTKQMSTLNTHTRYLHDALHDYADKLKSTLPPSLNRLIMTCTGSESNDLAIRIARKATGKSGFIVSEAAYHGNTDTVNEVSPSAMKGSNTTLSDRVVTFPVIDVPGDPREAEEWFNQQMIDAIALLDERGCGCAGLLTDSIYSSDGIVSHPAGFMRKGVDTVRKQGGLFIADEVQPGFGRTGDAMWGFQRHDLVPDMITMGKPMANGYPAAGMVLRLDLLENFCSDVGYFNTFGGSTVAVAACIALFDTLMEEGLMDNAREVGAYFKGNLESLAERYDVVGGVRGSGLFIGFDFCKAGNPSEPDTEFTTDIINELRNSGILIGAAGKYGNTLKIRPPLCFTRENADFFVETLDGILARVAR